MRNKLGERKREGKKMVSCIEEKDVCSGIRNGKPAKFVSRQKGIHLSDRHKRSHMRFPYGMIWDRSNSTNTATTQPSLIRMQRNPRDLGSCFRMRDGCVVAVFVLFERSHIMP
eukprot:TRINITY_DN4218_c1_g1_i1.p2 TRINITY_DN4218_c1_g1~~TRINITY_DN4218_c1_g1_i1.p2  ORF type:complete len:126 (-),score=11.45 TRINITY_DN4218_c1_g1_i1:211-549(-)